MMVVKRVDLKKKKVLNKQWNQVIKQENNLIQKKQSHFTEEKVVPLQMKLEEKIPDKVQTALESAFEKAFKLIFEKGVGMIEKSYNKEAQCAAFDINHYAVQRQTNVKHLKKIDQGARKEIALNYLLTTLEGSVLGTLGIGLPDIPLFIGMMLKNIYQISLAYGFDYTKNRERLYILYLICAGSSKGEQLIRYHKRLNEIADRQEEVEENELEQVMKETSRCLAKAMLISKFIQGLPVVGVVGGLSNWNMMKRVSDLAKIKYKKRYLKERLM